MRLSFSFFLLSLLFNYRLVAQNVINTDLPDQSDGTHLVENKHFQIENGVQFSRIDELTKGFDNITFIRYGVTKKFEIRLLNQYTIITDSNSVAGTQPITISAKNLLCKQKGWLPKLTLISYLTLPVTFSSIFPGDHFGYTFTLAARHDLNDKIKIYSNFSITEDQESTDISYLSTLEANYNITPTFSTFIEYFGKYAHHVNAANGMDIGVVYALKNNFALNASFGSSTLNLSVNNFFSFGMAVRFGTKPNHEKSS